MKGRELRAHLIQRDGPHCHWCGRLTVDPLQVGDRADEAQTVDHLDTRRPRRSVPDLARAVVACSRCNHDRGCLTVEEWRAVLEVRLRYGSGAGVTAAEDDGLSLRSREPGSAGAQETYGGEGSEFRPGRSAEAAAVRSL